MMNISKSRDGDADGDGYTPIALQKTTASGNNFIELCETATQKNGRLPSPGTKNTPSDISELPNNIDSASSPASSPFVVKLRKKPQNKQVTKAMRIPENSQEQEQCQQQQQNNDNNNEVVENGHLTNGTVESAEPTRVVENTTADVLSTDTAALLRRTMGALYELNPELEESTEEIRKLDSQLDNLNTYMDRVEERLKDHNDKLMETLKQQREDREKRRQSFHERLEASRQEDDDFQRQLNEVLSRVDVSRNNRQSMAAVPGLSAITTTANYEEEEGGSQNQPPLNEPTPQGPTKA